MTEHCNVFCFYSSWSSATGNPVQWIPTITTGVVTATTQLVTQGWYFPLNFLYFVYEHFIRVSHYRGMGTFQIMKIKLCFSLHQLQFYALVREGRKYLSLMLYPALIYYRCFVLVNLHIKKIFKNTVYPMIHIYFRRYNDTMEPISRIKHSFVL